MLFQELEYIGLSNKEAKVYLACLELGESNVQRIAQKSKIKRTTVYTIVETLKEKGILSETKRNKKTFYFAEDPRALQSILEEKRSRLEKILPELLSIANFIDKKPKIRYFEGDEGVREVYRDTLSFPGKEMLAWGSEKAVENFDPDFLNDYYVPMRIKNKNFIRAIATDNEVWRSYKISDQESLRKLKLVKKQSFSLPVEITLYGQDRIAILSFEEKIALIVESEKIHAAMKSIFELNWDALPEN